MQPDLENLEERIDRDRRQREEELFLLLLLLMRQSANRADMALALGADPFAAVADVLTGNAALNMPGAASRVARHLAAADVAGFRRTVRVIVSEGVTIEAELQRYAPARDYGSMARQAIAKALGTLQSRLAQAIREASVTGVSVRRAVRRAFEVGGYVESATSKAWLMESTAVTLTGFAWSGGWFAGWNRPAVAERLKGFRFSAVLDTRTTNICRACHGTKVPVDSPWIQTRTPPLHFNCRSVLLPIFRDFTPTETLPWTPWPMPGFGHAPAISVGVRFPAAA